MKRFRGGTIKKESQEPPEAPQPPQQPEPPEPSEPSDPSEQRDSSQSIDDENDEADDEAPFRNKLSPGVVFRWNEILNGTENFRFERFIGLGNFGKVFRCELPRINKVGAVKVQDHVNDNPFGHSEFVTEITMLHEANHPNVIKLLGKCFSKENSALVYEFLPNGSLEHHLFEHVRPDPGLRQKSRVLDWEARMKIAVGVADALVYLHTDLKVIHRDVKVTNILLDEDFTPKLTDFGLSTKIVENEDGVEKQCAVSPKRASLGYIPPEFEELELVTTKFDVYSYGVFLFVLFTGKKAYDRKRPVATRNIIDLLNTVWSREEHLPMIIDVALGNKFSLEGLNKVFLTARKCINAQALSRPDMIEVYTMVCQAAAYPVLEWTSVKKRLI